MREAIFELEQELRDARGYRRKVVEIQRALIEARVNDARRGLAELLLKWPSS